MVSTICLTRKGVIQYRCDCIEWSIRQDKLLCHICRVSSQRYSTYSFIWILNAPKLTKESKQEYIQWVESIIWTDMSDPASEAELFELELFKYINTQRHAENIGLINAGFILENSFHHQQFLQNLFPMICQRKLRFRY